MACVVQSGSARGGKGLWVRRGDVRALPSSKPAQYAKQCQKHQNNPTPTLSTKTRGVRRKSELGLYKFGPYGPVKTPQKRGFRPHTETATHGRPTHSRRSDQSPG